MSDGTVNEQPNEAPVIAVVDDSLTIRRFVSIMLEERYRTVEYKDGTEALAGMAASVPDLVLLDITLPDMEGTDVLRHMREHPALMRLPVIALTGNVEIGDQERYLALGFDSYIAKPITDEDLFFGEIARLLDARPASATDTAT